MNPSPLSFAGLSQQIADLKTTIVDALREKDAIIEQLRTENKKLKQQILHEQSRAFDNAEFE